jgi:hypothetical protein
LVAVEEEVVEPNLREEEEVVVGLDLVVEGGEV